MCCKALLLIISICVLCEEILLNSRSMIVTLLLTYIPFHCNCDLQCALNERNVERSTNVVCKLHFIELFV